MNNYFDNFQIVEMDVEKLIPYARNPRKNDSVVDKMTASIKEFGFKIPIVAKSNGSVVDGHLRLKAAIKMGLKTVPVVLADDLTETQIKAFRLLANQSVNWAEWDMDMLRLEIEDLKLENFDTNLIGFEDDFFNDNNNDELLINLGTDNENEISKPERDAFCKLGDVWQCGQHRLMCGDATSQENANTLMGGEKATLVFSDPPYGVSIGDKNKELKEKAYHAKNMKSITKNIMNDTLSDEKRYDLLVSALTNMKKCCTDFSSFYITLPLKEMHFKAMRKAGMPVKHVLIWLKNQTTFTMGRLDYEYKTEPILFSWAKTHKFYGKGFHRTNVWEIKRERFCNLHPTMKPVELVRNCILNSSLEGDAVVDFFGGSGTTMIACEQTNRKCFMMELDPIYCDVIIKRWQTFTNCVAIRQQDEVKFQC